MLALQFENAGYRTPASTAISFVRDTRFDLAFAGPAIGLVLFVLWANFIITAMSNGANLTDGLDGLATGASTMIFGAYLLIGIWTGNQNCQTNPGLKCYEVRDSLDLAIVAAAAMGACFGFLWWSASPAKIFMGDTGSLGLGGLIAGLAITTRTEFLSVILAGLFVLETLSVLIQVSVFKTTRKRFFRMAPLHHLLRNARVGADHGRHPVLDHRRAVRRTRPGHFLRRMGGGLDMSEREELSVPAHDGYEPRPGLTHREARLVGLAGPRGGPGHQRVRRCRRALWERGAIVTVVDASPPGASRTVDERAQILAVLGVDVRLGPEHTTGMPPGQVIDLVVTSPGWRPTHPVLADAAARHTRVGRGGSSLGGCLVVRRPGSP